METVRKILVNVLEMREMSARMVPRILTNSSNICPIWVFFTVIIGDTSWCFQYYLKIKCQRINGKQKIYQNEKRTTMMTYQNRIAILFVTVL